MLYDVRRLDWDDRMLERLRILRALLPAVRPSSGRFGVTRPDEFFGASVPVSGIAGDQQAAMFGQACYERGSSKNTYGTGSFVLLHTRAAAPPSQHGLVT